MKDNLKTTETSSSARCVDGTEITSKMSTLINVKINRKKCSATLSILDQPLHAFDVIAEEIGLRIHGGLGIDFLTSNNLILNFCNRIIIIHNTKKTV